MAKKDNLDSSLNDDGIFWQADNPGARFPGKVAFSGKHIHFTTSPVFTTLGTENLPELLGQFGQSSPVDAVPVLFGQLGASPCTLIDLHQMNDGGFTDLGRMESVSYKQYRVSLCVLGIHLAGPQEALITSARFTYSALKHWQKARFDVAFNDESTSIRLNRKDPPLVQGRSVDQQFLFSFDIKPELRIEGGEIRTRNEAVVEINPQQPKSLEWMFHTGYRLENFFCLVIGSSLRVQSIALKVGTETGWCRRQVRGSTKEIKHQVTVRPTSSQLAHSMALWLALPHDFDSFERLLYTIREQGTSVRTRFLSLANALEGFHRLTAPAATNRRISFTERIQELISRLSVNFAARLLGDPIAFEASLRATRDYFTHPGLPKQPSVLTDDLDMFLFTNKCDALLRFLVLLSVGLDEPVTADPIFQQSRLWG